MDPNTACHNVESILGDVSGEDEEIFKFCLCPYNPQISVEISSDPMLWPVLPASAPGNFMLPYFFAAMRAWFDRRLFTTVQVNHSQSGKL